MTDAREIIALQEFAKWAIREGAFQASDLDGLSIQEKAHELGLIEATTYDPEQHGPSDAAETGDDWFVFSPILTADGFRILGPDEVDPMTREKAAALADLAQAQREQLYSENGASINAHKAVQAEEIATAIRALGRKA